MKSALKIILVSAMATAFAIKAVPALAEAPASGETAVSVVGTADLDLGSSNGLRLLDRRLATAASDVCGTASDFDLRGKNDARQCRADVLESARAKARMIVAGATGERVIQVAAQH